MTFVNGPLPPSPFLSLLSVIVDNFEHSEQCMINCPTHSMELTGTHLTFLNHKLLFEDTSALFSVQHKAAACKRRIQQMGKMGGCVPKQKQKRCRHNSNNLPGTLSTLHNCKGSHQKRYLHCTHTPIFAEAHPLNVHKRHIWLD